MALTREYSGVIDGELRRLIHEHSMSPFVAIAFGIVRGDGNAPTWGHIFESGAGFELMGVASCMHFNLVQTLGTRDEPRRPFGPGEN